jgi:aryl-alcohol dehydrogenase-like predicted oxidoreductase
MGFGDAGTGFHSWVVGKEESTKAILGAYDLGVNFFDTANCYSFGTSEEYLGEAVKELPREEIVIATKVFIPMRTKCGGDDWHDRKTAPNGWFAHIAIGTNPEMQGFEVFDFITEAEYNTLPKE